MVAGWGASENKPCNSEHGIDGGFVRSSSLDGCFISFRDNIEEGGLREQSDEGGAPGGDSQERIMDERGARRD